MLASRLVSLGRLGSLAVDAGFETGETVSDAVLLSVSADGEWALVIG